MLRDSNPRQGHLSQTFFYEWSVGRNVAFADAHISFLADGIDPQDAEQLLNRHDRQVVGMDEVHGNPSLTRHVRVDNCIRLAVFVLLAWWPLPWVWIHPHGPPVSAGMDR